jgi:glycosyltransferase involved in cell wall biosynthesis
MTRVLHVHERGVNLETAESLRALGANAENSRTIGRGGDYTNVPWAVLGLRRLVDWFDIIHVWDRRSFAAASWAGAKRVVFTLPPELPPRGGLKNGHATLVCSTPAQLRRCNVAGISPERCHVIRSPLPNGFHAKPPNRAEMRTQLGLNGDDFVLLVPGESDRPAAHERAVWAASILHVTDERYRVLLWGRGSRLRIAAGLGDKLRQDGLVVVAEQRLGRDVPFDQLLRAADAMLVTATGPAQTLPVAMAMAAGVPVVAATRPEVAEMLTDDETALTVPTCTPRLLAQRVLDLRADAELARRVARSAEARVRGQFSTPAFVDAYQRVYLSSRVGSSFKLVI